MCTLVFVALDEENQETILSTKSFPSEAAADDYLEVHEQDIADNPEIYAVYKGQKS